MERVMGIEPTWPVWKTGTLPLSYTRRLSGILACRSCLSIRRCMHRAMAVERGSGAGNDFDAVDLRALNAGGEFDLELAVGHFHIHGFDVGALGTAGLGPQVKILEFMARDAVR